MFENQATRIMAQGSELRKYLLNNRDVEEEVLLREEKINRNTLYTLLYPLNGDQDICFKGEYFIKKAGSRLQLEDVLQFLNEKRVQSRGPNPPERLLYLYHHLHSAIPDKGLSMKELKAQYSELLESSGAADKSEAALKKMIERDIKRLEDIGIVLNHPSAEHKKYCLTEAYLPKISRESAAAVYVSMLLFQNTLLEEATSGAKEQLEKAFFNKSPRHPSMLSQRIHVVGDTLAFPEQFKDCLNKLIRSVLESYRIKISYEKNSGEVSERLLEPLGIICKRNVWYLVARANEEEEIKTFRVDQVLAINVRESEKFDYPDNFSIDAHIGDSWGVFCNDEIQEVKLKFTPLVARRVKNLRYHRSQEIVAQETDGSVVIKFSVCGLIELKTWIMQWGEQVEVLEPAFLREQIRAAAISIAAKY